MLMRRHPALWSFVGGPGFESLSDLRCTAHKCHNARCCCTMDLDRRLPTSRSRCVVTASLQMSHAHTLCSMWQIIATSASDVPMRARCIVCMLKSIATSGASNSLHSAVSLQLGAKRTRAHREHRHLLCKSDSQDCPQDLS